MRVSIVMPVFNGENFLRDAIESINSQTFTDWEFLIINEYGSNAATTAILQEYAEKDTRIIFIQNEKRLGIAASINVGINRAQGEYIVRMDADDISMPNRLEKQVQFMDNNPDIDICGLKPELFGESVWDWQVETDPDILKAGILFFTPFVHPTIIIRKARLNQYGLRYNEAFRYTEDYELFARATDFLTFGNLAESPALFHYRMHAANATAAGGNQGVQLYQDVSRLLFEECDLHFTKEEEGILCVHTYPREESLEDSLDTMVQLDLLLKKILFSPKAQEKYGLHPLFSVLHKRWTAMLDAMQWNKAVYKNERFTAAAQRGIFYQKTFYIANNNPGVVMPRVSIVLPTYNSERYIMDTVNSLLKQTYTDFELLVVNEYGSNDGTVEIVNMFHDGRIRIVQNHVKLGLAESLNVGFRCAKGKYIARADADDVYPEYRLERQVAYMDAHPDISVCGSWQHHFGKRNHIHMPAEKPEEIKAKLIFNCDLCHSTLLLRKDDFIKNDLWYDSSYLSEDFELWSRASRKLNFYNMPEVLGEYRWDGENITASKMDRLESEAQKIIARTLKEQLGLEIPVTDMVLLSGWSNPFMDALGKEKKALLCREKELLKKIVRANQVRQAYDPKALEKVLKSRWDWASGNAVEAVKQAAKQRIGFKRFLKKAVKRVLRPFHDPFKRHFIDPLKQHQQQLWNMDGHLWDYKQELAQQIRELQQTVGVLSAQVEQIQLQNNSTMEQLQEVNVQGIGRMERLEKNLGQSIDSRIWKAEENLLQTLDARIWRAEDVITTKVNMLSVNVYSKELIRISNLEKDKAKIFIFGTPFHSNLGDQAQAYCIKKWCEDSYPNHMIFELRSPSDDRFNVYPILFAIKEKLSPNDKIFIHSGYHTTDLYTNELLLNHAVLKVFFNYPVVMFPQSVYFENPKRLSETASLYNSHPHLLILAREPMSYEIAKREFTHTKVIFYPDIVNSLIGEYQTNPVERKGILFCKRDSDKEAFYSKDNATDLIKFVREKYDVDFTDTTLTDTCDEIEANRELYVKKTIAQYSKYRVVITDRMHGIIFALAANTPVIVLQTSGPKVFSSYTLYQKQEAFRHYVYFCDNAEDLAELVNRVMGLKLEYQLPPVFKRQYYDKLKDIVEDSAKGISCNEIGWID
ncbi:MAG: glycosyltransferase [Ruminococcaceae bacterium]|nr:glycosyltransferase [Oscillospiraceae bacterium]